jgi:23S rRNA pseudouridine1911/1915/1917 synthase
LGAYRGIVDLPLCEIKRLDLYVAENLSLMRRSQVKARGMAAEVNGKTAKLSRMVKSGDEINLSWEELPPLHIIPENIPLKIVYEDERVIVLNKAQGMVVHPGAGNWSGTLANALLWRSTRKQSVRNAAGFHADFHDFHDFHAGLYDGFHGSFAQRPFIVHRLDKDTSGLIIAAWDADALAFLSAQFKERAARKVYAAIVTGCPSEKRGFISSNIARDRHDRKRFTVSDTSGKSALTYYRVIKTLGGGAAALLLLRPKTGRTHQLRVHLRSIGHPIAGDPLYGVHQRGGGAALSPSMALHAKTLDIVLPDRKTRSRFTTKLPARFKEIMLRFDGGLIHP